MFKNFNIDYLFPKKKTTPKVEEETSKRLEAIWKVLTDDSLMMCNVKKREQEYIDEWLKEGKFVYTTEIQKIICEDIPYLEKSYYQKIADRIMEQSYVSLFDHHYYFMEHLITKWNLPVSYSEKIFMNSSNGWRDRSWGWNRDRAGKVFELLTNKNLKKEFYDMFIKHVIKSSRDDYFTLENINTFVEQAIEKWWFDKNYYQELMLPFLDRSKITSGTLSQQETAVILESLLSKKFEASFYQKIVDIILENKTFLQRFYNSGIFKKLCNLAGIELSQEHYKKIVDTCIDDYLNWTHKEMGKIHIKIALDTVKKGKLEQVYYDKVIKAGLELLISE